MPLTIHDIARMAGVSATTVSLVLNQKEGRRVGPETRRTILAIIAKHHYRRHTLAQGLTLGKIFQVGLCTSELLSDYPIIGKMGIHKAISYLAGYLRLAGYGVKILQIERDMPTPRIYGQVAKDLIDERADGYIFIKWFRDHASGVMQHLRRRKIPAVALDSELNKSFTWAKIDHKSAFYQGTQDLIDRGFTRIACFSSPFPPQYEGYVRAMKEHNLAPWLYLLRPKPNFFAATIRSETETMLAAHPDTQAVFLNTTHVPIVLDLLTPRGIALMGHGDPDFTLLSWQKYPNWSVPLEKLCKTCVDLLTEQLEKGADIPPRQVILPCEFCPS
ncbi:MAG: LacI family DNA-binding transcriptional regulator [Kiritimatiellae bacterium]|nr:LacI family DNA-binding transcriptional regulator [Kiritimatiellia bacterium]